MTRPRQGIVAADNGPAVSPPPGLANGLADGEASPAMRRIGAAVRAGRTAEAWQLAEQLQHELAAEAGPEHPDVLRVQEVRAYLAHRSGDHRLAARLYRETAAVWSLTGALAYWHTTINARVCEALAARQAAAGPAPGTAVAASAGVPAGHLRRGPGAAARTAASGARALSAPAARRSAVLALVVAAAVVTGAERIAPERGRTERITASELTAAPVLQALEHAPVPMPEPAATPLGQAAAPIPTPPPAPEPEPEPEPEPDDALEPEYRGADVAPGPPAAPSRSRPARSSGRASGPTRPREPKPPHSKQPPFAPADVCAQGGRYGLPGNLVDMCRKAYAR
ncbi:hypothetical protein OG871_38745 [Kitasatospora sp. NBC_00374]|uniref:hypothetical protein n=1 Tax=Kitasatospora sp. NBC_00374 TaxID=2975964 RepID=UPI0030E2747D